ncbi:MAG: DNA-binding protein [Acidobacteriota bacterium]|nr:DNA-binding protein [Acidobacteriota bacterium]
MNAITITIPDEQMEKLREAAARLGLAPEELARVGVEELLKRPDDEFGRAADYVLRKNEELYRRLA